MIKIEDFHCEQKPKNGHTTLSEDYVSFELAKLLKEKGFNISLDSKKWICCMYDENGNIHWGIHDKNWYFRITLQMAMKWLREVYKLEVRSTYDYDKDSWWGNINPMFEETDENTNVYQEALRFDYQGKSYEDAVETSLKYTLEKLI